MPDLSWYGLQGSSLADEATEPGKAPAHQSAARCPQPSGNIGSEQTRALIPVALPDQEPAQASKPDAHAPAGIHPESPEWLQRNIDALGQKFQAIALPAGSQLLGKQVAFALLESYTHRTTAGQKLTMTPGLHVGRCGRQCS